jgi:hypothetical protein
MRRPSSRAVLVAAAVTAVVLAAGGGAALEHPVLAAFGLEGIDTDAPVFLVRAPFGVEAEPGLVILARDGVATLVTADAGVLDRLAARGARIVPLRDHARDGSRPARASVAAPPFPRAAKAADPAVQAMVDQVTWARISAHIGWLEDFGTRYSYAAGCDAAADSLFARFAALGLDVEFHPFTVYGHDMRNVVATQTGTTKPDSIYVICAHYDDTSETPYVLAPGADDNASGTAAVLLAAEILSGHAFAYTIKYICFAGEEQGLQGSTAWTAWAAAEGLGIVGALNYDMIGWWTDGVDFDLELEANNASVWLVDAVAAAIDLYTTMPYEIHVYDGAWWGDHASFWDQGWCAVNDEESWDWGDPDFNPNYHTTRDQLAFIDEGFAVGCTRAAVASIAVLASPDPLAAAAPSRPAVAFGAHPNPFNGRTTLVVEAAAGGDDLPARIEIFDLRGRRVDALDVRLRDGRAAASWEAVGRGGAPLPSGAYLCRLRGAGLEARTRVTYLK